MNSERRASSAVPDDDTEFEEIFVWPDEIRLGDIYGGFVVTGVNASEHYRDSAVRLTIFTDPAELDEGVRPEEWGRLVLRTDRVKGHQVPVLRRVM